VPVRTLRTPSYRLHKPTNQAVVTLNGNDFYLGRFGSPESRAEYDRLIIEWIANGRCLRPARPETGSDIAVNELLEAYLAFADAYYVKRSKPTTEAACIRVTIRPLRQLYGETMARHFGPLQLKAVRKAMVPPSAHHGLAAVSRLRRGRADVRESEPVRPVPDAFVDAIQTHVSRQVWVLPQSR
jgi:hypothetical protein